MRKLKCPKCGAVLTVDEADNTPFLDRVKNDAFDAGVSKRLTELHKQQKIEQTTTLLQSEQRLKDSDIEYIFIMFEMKNETDMTTTKHKNKDFFAWQDKDRTDKGREYAVLMSILRAESELYNNGIMDVSHHNPKMPVICLPSSCLSFLMSRLPEYLVLVVNYQP